MYASFSEIERQAKSLSANERAQLAESLLASLGTRLSEVEAAWAQEIENRVGSYDNGEIEAVSASEVFAETRSLAH